MRLTNYAEAMEFLYGRLNYERAVAGSYTTREWKLERMVELLERIGNPQEHLPVIHIAGTKGKGSTAAMLAALLTSQGSRIGLFTSPHIAEFEERIRIDGVPISRDALFTLVQRIAPIAEEMDRRSPCGGPTFFELATALGWLAFAEAQTDLAVLEVGLGGRLDSTNICRPLACVITSISLDHTNLLGNSLAEIAGEKAGIIKPGVPVFAGAESPEADAVIAERARDAGADLYRLDHEITFDYAAALNGMGSVSVTTPWQTWSDVPLPLLGRHQAANAALALAAFDHVQRATCRDRNAAHSAMRSVTWPARIEVVRRHPTVIVDSAHNRASVQSLLETLAECFPATRKTLLFATSGDKDVAGMLELLVPRFDHVIVTQYWNNPRAVPAGELERHCLQIGHPAEVAADPRMAWDIAERNANPNDLICITGSFFLAAELRDLLTRHTAPAREAL